MRSLDRRIATYARLGQVVALYPLLPDEERAAFDEWDRARDGGQGSSEWPGWAAYIDPIPAAPALTKPTRRRRSLSTRVMLAVFKRDGYRCVDCGTDEELTVDHVIPLARGGADEMSNYRTRCRPCNSRKGARV